MVTKSSCEASTKTVKLMGIWDAMCELVSFYLIISIDLDIWIEFMDFSIIGCIHDRSIDGYSLIFYVFYNWDNRSISLWGLA
jgi:hypothetical protein